MLHSNFQKKNSHCQQQAINTLQSIFPSINLPQFSKHSSVWQVLERSAKNLPRPGLGDITSAISNMKTVVDSQQLKIQKNMIEIQKCQQIIMSSKKYNPTFNSTDQPTAVKLCFDNCMQQQSESQMEQEIHTFDKYELRKKNQFFSEPEEIDYFQPCVNEELKNPFDDEEDVKKYLSFDF